MDFLDRRIIRVPGLLKFRNLVQILASLRLIWVPQLEAGCRPRVLTLSHLVETGCLFGPSIMGFAYNVIVGLEAHVC